jgi:hypothetical protein
LDADEEAIFKALVRWGEHNKDADSTVGDAIVVYCLLARSCLGVRVVAPGVPLERRESRDGKSLDLTRMHGSGKLMRVLQASCRGRSRCRPTLAPWCKEKKHHQERPCVATNPRSRGAALGDAAEQV